MFVAGLQRPFATLSALLGPREMPDLSPHSGPQRTLIGLLRWRAFRRQLVNEFGPQLLDQLRIGSETASIRSNLRISL
jgi:hypothetical protein